MRAARRVRVGAVDVGVGGPVLDEEAVAAAARGVGVVAAAKHPVELGEHPASDVCVRQPPHPLRPRARHKADDGVGRRRVGPHQLGGGREPHLRQERVGADGVVKVGRPEAAPQPHDHLERGPHLELANRSCLRRRQRRPKLRLPPLQYGQRHGDHAGARAHHSAAARATLSARPGRDRATPSRPAGTRPAAPGTSRRTSSGAARASPRAARHPTCPRRSRWQRWHRPGRARARRGRSWQSTAAASAPPPPPLRRAEEPSHRASRSSRASVRRPAARPPPPLASGRPPFRKSSSSATRARPATPLACPRCRRRPAAGARCDARRGEIRARARGATVRVICRPALGHPPWTQPRAPRHGARERTGCELR
mmetsp:Transcript_50805/g.166004  ORF Transcript_50805/g.166004 Transcript_50805/m.166004 type:complete len:368 (+) Transcript_50805:355-1458(+)